MTNRNNRNSLIDCLTNRRVVVGVFVAICVMVSLAGIAVAHASSDAVLVLHFDEGSGTIAYDSSGNGNDGTIHGATWTNGISGKALAFDGVDDYVEIPDSNSIEPEQLSISLWIKPYIKLNDSIGVPGIPIIEKTNEDRYWSVDGYDLLYSGGLVFGLGKQTNLRQTVGADVDLNANIWYYIVATYDKNKMKLYLNGQEIANRSDSFPIVYGSCNLWFGKFYHRDTNYFYNGIIDEVRIYSRALTANEVKVHYEEHKPASNLTDWAYSKTLYIQENSGETLTDYQVLVNLSGTFPVGANADGSDLRFVDTSGKELSYWIENYDAGAKTAKIWVKVPSISANGEAKIKMYYGNEKAGSVSDGDATFEFFDDFEGNELNATVWEHGGAAGGSYSISNSHLALYCGGSSCSSRVTTKAPMVHVNDSVAIEMYGYETDYGYSNYHCTQFSCSAKALNYGQMPSGSPRYSHYIGNYDTALFRQDYPPLPFNTYQTRRIIHQGTEGTSFYTELESGIEYADQAPHYDSGTEWKLNLYCYHAKFWIDWVKIRKYTSPEPTVTFEELEKKPDLIITNIWWDKENPKIGDEVSFSYTVENKGTADTPNDFGNQLLIDDEGWDISARGSLEAGKSKERFFTHVWIAEAGNYTINVVADWEGCINESDDTNNFLTKHLEVVNLDGWVLSDDTGNGVVGVTVTLSPGGMSTITSPNGYYYFTVLPEDDYAITASLEGYTFDSVTCSVYHDATITAPNITGTSDNIITMIDHDRVLIKENTKAEGPNKKVDEYAEVSMYTQRRSSDIIEVYVELNSISVKTDKETGEIVKIEFGEGFNQGAVTLLADENATILWEDRKILVRSEEFIVGSITMNLGYYGDPNVKEPAEKYIVVLPDGTEIDLGYKGGNITPAFYYKYRGDMPYSEWNESYCITSLAQTLPPNSIPYIGSYIGTLFTVDNLLRHFVGVETIAQLLDKDPLELYVENYDEILMTWMGQDPLCHSSHTCDFDAIVMKVPIKIDPYTTHKISVRGKASLYAYSGYEDLVFAKDFEINKDHKLASPVTAGTPMRMDFKSEDESLELLDEEIITNETDEIKFAVMLLSSSEDSKTKYIVVETSQIPTLDEEGNLKADPIMQKGFVSIAIDERAQVDIDSITTKYLVGDDFPCEPPLVLSDPSPYPDMYNIIPELNEDNLEVALDILSLIPKFKTLAVPIINIKRLDSFLADSPDDLKQAYANDAEFDVYDIVWCDKSWKILPHNNVVVIIPVRFYSDNSEIAVRAGVSTSLYAGTFKRVFIYSKMLDA